MFKYLWFVTSMSLTFSQTHTYVCICIHIIGFSDYTRLPFTKSKFLLSISNEILTTKVNIFMVTWCGKTLLSINIIINTAVSLRTIYPIEKDWPRFIKAVSETTIVLVIKARTEPVHKFFIPILSLHCAEQCPWGLLQSFWFLLLCFIPCASRRSGCAGRTSIQRYYVRHM